MELAIFADCLKLIDEFVRIGDTSFNSFCNEWKNMAFQHIFSAQTSNIEICQTTTAIMHLAKRTVCGYSTTGVLLKSHEDSPIEHKEYRLRRLGALYLMYAVYFKQPTQNYIKAEVTMKTWRELRDFVKSYTQEAKQARYIFWKLTKSGAFRFTASDNYMAVDGLVNYDDMEKHDLSSTNLQTDLVRELSAIHTIQTALPSLVALEKQYNVTKKQLTDNNESLSAQALPPLDIFQKIQNVFNRIENTLRGNEEVIQDVNDTHNTRRAIKRKAYGANCSNNEQFSQDEGTADEEYDDMYNNVSKRKTTSVKRVSAITVFSEELPKELLEDLHNEHETVDNVISSETVNADTTLELPNLDIQPS